MAELTSAGDMFDRVSAFRRAYGNAREIVQSSILQTILTWKGEWEYEGRAVDRSDLGKAYSMAPDDLRLAIDWQLHWDSPALIQSDAVRRALEYHRRSEAGDHEDFLSLERFGREFDAASPTVKHAVVCTYSAWVRLNEGRAVKPPSRSELGSAYDSASHLLKTAMCYVLELGLTYPVESPRDIDDHKACVHDIVNWQNARARRWEAGDLGDYVD